MNYENIGVIYLKKKNFLKAVDFLTRVVNGEVNRPFPLDGKAEYLIGKAYLEIDSKEEACKYFLRSKNLNNPYGFRLYSENCK